MSWAIDRVGRSLHDLLDTIAHLEVVGVDLYLDQQNIDTTTPTGKLLFQITGAFAAFEAVDDSGGASTPVWHEPGRKESASAGQTIPADKRRLCAICWHWEPAS